MGYEYHVFLSYRRHGEWPDWVNQTFLPLFKHYLGEELGEELKVFYDIESIPTGVSWPKKLGDALARSCILVPLFSKQYFISPWCQLELANMLAREEKTGFGTAQRPERLIIPARIHDGQYFPRFIGDIQCACLEHCSNVRLARNSLRGEELTELIQKWVPDVASAVERAPEYNSEWHQLAIDEFMKKFDAQKPRQRKIPRLG
ncbi:toll/interleukin-1 receptor domain-containing protein [Adonisia turfae]|uniref:TIR domain-containing protein n=1 Tax=Adonisia turfae CCMR0081 TaxID=2292702 RepID=A0A6M0RHY0_9CYAN|nr:toll/interleukin-1 receptor domain-containing protein [Adonisia turfae]NEZ55824.1 TIR domain-containing protein [Adonisia turfae CCMR0081]